MNTIWLDLRHAARALLRAYVTIVSVRSIGPGVGAAAAVFSWMDGLGSTRSRPLRSRAGSSASKSGSRTGAWGMVVPEVQGASRRDQVVLRDGGVEPRSRVGASPGRRSMAALLAPTVSRERSRRARPRDAPGLPWCPQEHPFVYYPPPRPSTP